MKISRNRFSEITIQGARTNNLKNIDISIPLGKITCIYGPSGSGKSSLAFGTLVDESKRRFINSLPNDIKFLWNLPQAADVDRIEPILPVWALSQINPVVGSRPVVSDLLGITELLSRHYCLNGGKACSICGGKVRRSSLEDHTFQWSKKLSADDILHFLIKKEFYTLLTSTGYPVRSCKSKASLVTVFDKDHEYWEVGRCKLTNLKKGISRIVEFIGKGNIEILMRVNGSKKSSYFVDSGYSCHDCGQGVSSSDFAVENFNPLLASGACERCDGFGQILEYDLKKIIKNEMLTLDEGAIPLLTYKQFNHLMSDFKKDLKLRKINPELPFIKMPKSKYEILEKGVTNFCGLIGIYEYLNRKRYKRSIRILSRRLKSERDCEDCEATRLKTHKISISIKDKSLHKSLALRVAELGIFLKKNKIKKDLSFEKLSYILETAKDLGLGKLILNRKVKTLSSGEYQRLLLVKILAQKGTGMLFVFDEPSRGLSTKEQDVLLNELKKLKGQGNTVLLVDHSEYMQNSSDFLIKMGPGAGSLGGYVESIKKIKTKKYSTEKVNKPIVKNTKTYIDLIDIKILDKKIKKLKIPLYKISWIIGDSGSGKSLIFKHVLYNHLEWMHTGLKTYPLEYDLGKMHCTNVISKVNYFDPELRTSSSRSSVGTYLGFADIVRKHYSSLDISKKLGYELGHFSPNSDLGKCSTCEGRGVLEIDMQFLESLIIKCEDCNGKRLKENISSISDGRITVDESYNLPLIDVIPFLKLTPKFLKLIEYTKLLNLSHLSLARTLKSLSGGERLRLQFLKSLNMKSMNELFIFDNLSIGLSANELGGVCQIISALKKNKNTVIIIDSNPYFSRAIDNTIDFNTL